MILHANLSGRINRLITCLNGLESLVAINFSDKEKVDKICIQVYTLLKQEVEEGMTATILTAKKYRLVVSEEPGQHGVKYHINPVAKYLSYKNKTRKTCKNETRTKSGTGKKEDNEYHDDNYQKKNWHRHAS